MDSEQGRLTVNAVFAEADAPGGPAVGRAVAAAIKELAAFLAAREIRYSPKVPPAWKKALRS